MGNISVSLPSDGTTADVADYNTPITTIVNTVNGGLDNTNIASGAAIATSKLADDAGITTAKIADAAITPAKLLAGTGTTWAWQSWTPTLVNLSGGTLNFAKYNQTGKTVRFRFKYTMAGANVGSGVTITLPVTANSDYAAADTIAGTVSSYDLSALTAYLGVIRVASTTVINIRTVHTDGPRANYEELASNNPTVWASGDILMVSGEYEAA